MGTEFERLSQDFRELERRVNEQIGVGGQITTLGAQSIVDPQPLPVTPPNPTADQQIKNGDASHSVNTYYDTVAAPGTDKVLECANFWVSDTPASGQALDVTTTSETNPDNKTLKAAGHSHYDARQPDWGLPAGTFRMSGTSAINAPFPSNAVYPGRTMYLGSIIALRNSTIKVRDDTRVAAALYNNTLGELDFMRAGQPFAVRGQVRGTPGATTERRYKILAQTDRGYTFLSAELPLLNAPADGSFASNVDVSLNWDAIDGILKYQVYRFNVVAGTYDLLREVTSGANTYGDNNSVLKANVGGYPVATDDRVKCFIATVQGALANLPVDGVAAKWADLFLNIPVPAPLEKTGTGNQVLRIYVTTPLDREPSDAVSVAGNNSIQSTTGAFTALDTGRLATLYDADRNILHGPEAITFVDADHVTFATNVATGYTDGSLFIVEGGDHGLLLDMIHIGYIAQAKYAAYPDDKNRVLPSTAAPNTSGQGGIGGGGDSGDPGDGGIGCVTFDTPITRWMGNVLMTNPLRLILPRDCLFSGNLHPNWVQHVEEATTDNLHEVFIRSGSWFYDVFLECSPGHPFMRSQMDTTGTRADRLHAGDEVVIHIDGQLQLRRIRKIVATGKSARVGSPTLEAGHWYAAGSARFRSVWHRLLFRLTHQKLPILAALGHNRKNRDGSENPL